MLCVINLAVRTAAGQAPQNPFEGLAGSPAALPRTETPGPPSPPPAAAPAGLPEERDASWKRLVPNILDDQKRIWLFPRHWFQGKYLIPTGSFLLATAGLVALDPYTEPYFRRTQAYDEFNRVVSSRNSVIGMFAVPLSAYGAGLARHDDYLQQTALLTAEAVVDSEVLTQVTKATTRRLLPGYIAPSGDFSDSWFRNHSGPWYAAPGSFPSGHMIAAMSVATVFARRYGHTHRWVPLMAYGLAGMVGFSRLTLSAHFPSDVFAATFLGYTIARYDVLRNQ
jgi:membrane-associated PAP2 superfamily phosphatase